MAIALEPVAPAGLPRVLITAGSFRLAPDSEDLAAWGPRTATAVAAHAGIIIRDGQRRALLVTGPGASHNGSPVAPGRAVELHPGDELRLGEALHLRIAPDPRADDPPSGLQVTLSPADGSPTTELIVLESLPLLVGRDTRFLRDVATRLPAVAGTVSRRHALIFERRGTVFVEDLASTNGTTLNGRPIEPLREVRVQPGDTLGFGGRELQYAVHYQPPDPDDQTRIARPAGADGDDATRIAIAAAATRDRGTPGDPPPARAADPPGAARDPQIQAPADAGTPPSGDGHTVYIRTADSFLDLFLDPPATRSGTGPGTAGPGAPDASKGRGAAADREPPSRLRRAAPWAAVVVALGGGAIAYQQYHSPQRTVSRLLGEHQYEAALVQVERHLQDRPGDETLQRLAGEALVRWVVPAWSQAVLESRLDAAQTLLADAAANPAQLPENRRLLALLGWALDLERYLALRGGADAPLMLFRDEAPLASLLARWDADASTWEPLMVRVGNQVPEFQEQRARILSRLRTLRNDQMVYVSAIEALERELVALLERGSMNEAELRLATFVRQYPRVTGTGPLREDIARMAAAQSVLEAGDMRGIIALEGITFETGWVRETASRTLWPRMPTADTVRRYREGLESWRRGDAASAIARLESLASAPDGAPVAATLAHFRRVSDTLAALRESSAETDHHQRVAAFALTLDAELDGVYLARLEPELQQAHATLHAELAEWIGRAAERWGAYRQDGGISGLMRLEDSIGEPFRAQSARLYEAWHAVREADRRMHLLHIVPDTVTRQLRQAVLAEVRLQRRSLSDLGLVLEQELLREKLELLPEPEES